MNQNPYYHPDRDQRHWQHIHKPTTVHRFKGSSSWNQGCSIELDIMLILQQQWSLLGEHMICVCSQRCFLCFYLSILPGFQWIVSVKFQFRTLNLMLIDDCEPPFRSVAPSFATKKYAFKGFDTTMLQLRWCSLHGGWGSNKMCYLNCSNYK